jgi:SAM-dependent methyltransferase
VRTGIALALALTSVAAAQDQAPPRPAPPTPPAAAPAKPASPSPRETLEQIRADAAALEPLVKSDLAREFLAETAALPPIEPRTLYVRMKPREVYTAAQAAEMTEQERASLKRLDFDTRRYYETFYGSPLAYARVVDLAAGAGLAKWQGMHVLDYGYGNIGHLRLMAGLGADVMGVDVDPIIATLYRESGDTGLIQGTSHTGRLALVNGVWPKPETIADVAAGYDIITSKNTLKNGYVNPPAAGEGKPAPFTLDLGGTPEAFIQANFEALKPGGFWIIYNLGPGPAKEGEPFKAMADIRCPFPRGALENAGFMVLAYDQDDTEQARAIARSLGWDKGPDGKAGMDVDHDLFASYTLMRRNYAK